MFFFHGGSLACVENAFLSPWRASGIVSARFCLVAVSTLQIK